MADKQPDEIGELTKLINEFIDQYQYIENEINDLKKSQKDLIEKYKNSLDIKSLKAAISVAKIKKKVTDKNNFDIFLEILEKENI